MRENHGARDVPALNVIVMATTLQEHFYSRFLERRSFHYFRGRTASELCEDFYKVLERLRATGLLFPGSCLTLQTFFELQSGFQYGRSTRHVESTPLKCLCKPPLVLKCSAYRLDAPNNELL